MVVQFIPQHAGGNHRITELNLIDGKCEQRIRKRRVQKYGKKNTSGCIIKEICRYGGK